MLHPLPHEINIETFEGYTISVMQEDYVVQNSAYYFLNLNSVN